jgi:DNA-binding MurR/RpiR family transcriptional regulator
VIQATLARHQANLQQAYQNLSQIDLDKICDVLIKARRTLVWASGSCVVVGTLLVRLLKHIGLKGELMIPSGVDTLITMYDIGPEDVVIGIGLWLTFNEVVDALNLARRLGAQTMAITGSPTSQLIKTADYVVIAPAQGAAISFSVVAQIAVVEVIIARIAAHRAQKTVAIEQALHDLYLEEKLLAPLLD